MKRLDQKQFKKIKNIFILTAVPLLFTVLFGLVYSNIYVENLPFAVLDLDQTSSSRTVIESFCDSAGFGDLTYTDDQEELDRLLLEGRVSAGLIFPDEFGAKLLSKQSPGVIVLIDGTNIVVGNNAYAYASNILTMINAGIQVGVMEAGDMVPYMAEQNIASLSFVDRMLYDPAMGYFNYVFAGLLGIFIQQTYLGVIVPDFIEEKYRLKRSKHKFHEKAERKLLIKNMGMGMLKPALLTFVCSVLCFWCAHEFFGYPLRGSIAYCCLLQLIYVINLTAVGILIAAFFENVPHSVQFIMFLSIPTLLTSGYVWPQFSMAPGFEAVIEKIWPLIYFVNPMRDLQLKGAGFGAIESYVIGGILFAAFWIPVGLFVYFKKIEIMRQNLNRMPKRKQEV